MSRTRRTARAAVVTLGMACAVPASLVAPGAVGAADTWTAVGPAGVVAHEVVVARSNPQRAYAATASGVLRSDDGGATWTATAATVVTTDVVVDPANPDVAHAVGPEGYIGRTVDGGATWTVDFSQQAIDLDHTPDHLVVMNQPNNVAYSVGAGWSGPNEIEFAYRSDGVRVEWGPNSQPYAVAASDGLISTGGDGPAGVIWLALSNGLVRVDFDHSVGHQLMPIGQVRAVDVAPDGMTVLAGHDISLDSGQNWEPPMYLPGYVSAEAVALDVFSTPGAAYVATDASTSGGESVFRRGPGDTAWTALGLAGRDVNGLAAHGGRVLAATSNGLYRYGEAAPPPPTPTAVSPSSTQACSVCDDLPIVVTGSDFNAATVVRLDGTPLATSLDSATQLSALMPAALRATARTASVDVAVNTYVSRAVPLFVTETSATVVGSVTSTNSDPAADAEVASPDGAISAIGDGVGSLSLAGYSANPVAVPAPSGAGRFFDVYVAPGSSFGSVTVVNCALDPANASHVIYWWDGSQWSPVSDQSYDAATGCVTLTFDAASSPSSTQLTGTVFADVPAGRAGLTRSSTAGTPVTAAPGRWLAVGYRLKLGTKSSSTTDVVVSEASYSLLARCGASGPEQMVSVPVRDGRYAVPAGSKGWYPTSDTDSPTSFQGSVQVPNICAGQLVTLTGAATFSATLTTSPTAATVEVQLHHVVLPAAPRRDIDCADPVANPEPGAKDCHAGWRTTA